MRELILFFILVKVMKYGFSGYLFESYCSLSNSMYVIVCLLSILCISNA